MCQSYIRLSKYFIAFLNLLHVSQLVFSLQTNIFHVWFQASTAVYMAYLPLCDVMQHILLVCYWCFLDCLTLKDGTDRLSQNICNYVQVHTVSHPRRVKILNIFHLSTDYYKCYASESHTPFILISKEKIKIILKYQCRMMNNPNQNLNEGVYNCTVLCGYFNTASIFNSDFNTNITYKSSSLHLVTECKKEKDIHHWRLVWWYKNMKWKQKKKVTHY
jgi:hypothetical protein